jgi:FMN-dependent oxidoreductase (nitrilotriacetate monooxygenase family)
MADEYMTVVYKLWEQSWEEDAVVKDAENDIYTDPSKVHRINHEGQYFKVPGPHLCEPSPQRTPVIYQAGTSGPGKNFAAKHAEAIFVSGNTPEDLRPSVDDVRALAAKQGRDPKSIKVITLLGTIIGDTEEEAQAKYADFQKYASETGALALFGGWTGVDLSKYPIDEELKLSAAGSNAIQSALERWSKAAPGVEKWTPRTVGKHIAIGGLGPVAVGTASSVADQLEQWVEVADVDGFNLSYVAAPGTFEDVVNKLVPELQRRGIFRTEVEGKTMREGINQVAGTGRLNADHPAHRIIADRIPDPAK